MAFQSKVVLSPPPGSIRATSSTGRPREARGYSSPVPVTSGFKPGHLRRGRSQPWLACLLASGASYWCCFQTLTLLFQFSFQVDGHAHWCIFANRNVSVYWLWLLLDISVVSVVIVIIAICDMPRQEFSLCEGVYSQYIYEKKKVVFWNMTQILSNVSRTTCA